MLIMVDSVIIHSSEICLKGGNRRLFEAQMVRNIKERLSGLGDLTVKRRQGSTLVTSAEPLTPEVIAKISRRLRTVFGLSHILFAARCGASLDEIGKTSLELMRYRPPNSTFKVETRRCDKSFPIKSPEMNRRLGAHLLESLPGLKVDVHVPETRLQIEIDRGQALVAADRVEGWDGLPVGTAGKLVVLLSGGIDSPLAVWKVMRRGCQAIFVHFHSYPFVGRQSMDKVKRLAGVLNDYQSDSVVYFVPFADAQKMITDRAKPSLRIILYRRMMLRIAEMAARAEGALGLVTGDSIGQVASQTLENMAAVSAAASLPVYRPLVGDNKEEIITWARKIGTYDISIEPHDDCCSLFLPPRPAIRSTAAEAAREEARFDAATAAALAWEKAERTVINGKTWDIE
jgi:tRNA uracil 4-sulfurtransferase